MAVSRARVGGAPIVLTSHGTDLFLLDRNKIARPLASRVFRRAARITVISSPLVNRVTQLGVPLDRISVIPMPVDGEILAHERPREEQRQSREVRLLFAGRLIERKGAEYAIRALKLLNSRGVDASLTIVGDGPLRVDLDHLCDELDLGTLVRFTGMLPPAGVVQQMNAADILLMPAVTDWKGEQEGFGMVIVEAMLSGLPVVASASGGITDIITDGVNGILVPERETDAIAAAVARLGRNTELAVRLREAARTTALQHFHPDAIAGRFEEVYLSAADTARPNRKNPIP
jgi:glycosyltransferase involved in cell wall biosynthesis